MTQEHKIQEGYEVVGMCYCSGRLYTIEGTVVLPKRRLVVYRLAVYSVSDQDTVTLLDTLDLNGFAKQPRVDCNSGRVYIPCRNRGICVVRYDDSKLVPITTLTCVWGACSLAIASPDTLYVCDWVSVCLVNINVTSDRVTDKLQRPRGITCYPWHIAFLGDTVLVNYGAADLVIYQHGAPTPGKVILRPQGLESVIGLTTDHHSSFLLSCRTTACSHSDSLLPDDAPRRVYVLDVSGNLIDTIYTHRGKRQEDCTLVGKQLWVGYENGYIIVMS